jgi:hypothetical protein
MVSTEQTAIMSEIMTKITTESTLMPETSEGMDSTHTVKTMKSTMSKRVTPEMKSGGWNSKCNLCS